MTLSEDALNMDDSDKIDKTLLAGKQHKNHLVYHEYTKKIYGLGLGHFNVKHLTIMWQQFKYWLIPV